MIIQGIYQYVGPDFLEAGQRYGQGRGRKAGILVLWFVLFSAVLLGGRADAAFAGSEGQQLCSGKTSAEPLDIQRYVEINGIRQWVTIKGSKCSNPVILNVHGGPGNPVSNIASQLYKEWEEEFTVVNWDQRGSGRTFEANHEYDHELSVEETVALMKASRLDVALLVEDGLELTDYILKLLNKDKLILTGTSWGTVPATHMAATAPERFYFYVSVSPITNYRRNTAASYQQVRERALEYGDQEAIRTLDSIGPPPWSELRSFGRLRRIIRAYEAKVTGDHAVGSLAEALIPDVYKTERARMAYLNGENLSFLKYLGLNRDGMAQSIALDEQVTAFEIPVYVVQGAEDLLMVPEVTERYFDLISAPEKAYSKLERSGHETNWPILRQQLEFFRIGMNKVRAQ